MEAPESALVLPVPEAEGTVGRYRTQLDPAAALGVPAHITLLYPFVDPGVISQQLLDQLDALFGALPRIEFALTEVRWFGNAVVWLHPEPVERVMGLISAVRRRYPDYPPYGGAYDETVPHLTVGQHNDPRRLQRAADEVATRLPISAGAERVDLMTGSLAPGSWQTVASFPLAARVA